MQRVRVAYTTDTGMGFAILAFMKTSVQKRSVRATSGLCPRTMRPLITCEDRRSLGSLAADDERCLEPQAIGALDARLDDAVYVERDKIPATVVTMNSTVELVNLRTHECFLATLVYPDDAEFIDDSISVLDPLGIALLGSSVGSVLKCQKDRRTTSFLVERVIHQPEQH
jgi:transcription elongation GreA/GreB family factor